MTHPTALGTSRRTLVGALGLGTLGLGALAAAPSAAAAPAGLVVPPGVSGPGEVDLFLTADGITGDSTDRHFPGAVELVAADWSVSATRAGGTGSGAGTGRPVAADVQVAARSGSASPVFLRRLVQGRHIRTAAIHVVRRGEKPVEVMTLGFTDVVLTHYEVSTSGGWPVDVVAFAMGSVTETYRPQKADGSTGQPVSVTWDLRTTRVS